MSAGNFLPGNVFASVFRGFNFDSAVVASRFLQSQNGWGQPFYNGTQTLRPPHLCVPPVLFWDL